MTLYRAVVEVLVEADNEAGAMDAVAEMLRPLLQDPTCNMLDWQYAVGPDSGLYGKPTELSRGAAERTFDEFTA